MSTPIYGLGHQAMASAIAQAKTAFAAWKADREAKGLTTDVAKIVSTKQNPGTPR